MPDTIQRPRPHAPTHCSAEQYDALYRRSMEDPDGFWLEQARRLDWITPPTTGGQWSFDPVDIKDMGAIEFQLDHGEVRDALAANEFTVDQPFRGHQRLTGAEHRLGAPVPDQNTLSGGQDHVAIGARIAKRSGLNDDGVGLDAAFADIADNGGAGIAGDDAVAGPDIADGLFAIESQDDRIGHQARVFHGGMDGIFTVCPPDRFRFHGVSRYVTASVFSQNMARMG